MLRTFPRLTGRFTSASPQFEALVIQLASSETLPEVQDLLATARNISNFNRSSGHVRKNPLLSEFFEFLTPSELSTLAKIHEKSNLLPPASLNLLFNRISHLSRELDEIGLSDAVYAMSRSIDLSVDDRHRLLSSLAPEVRKKVRNVRLLGLICQNFVVANFKDVTFSKKLTALISTSGESEMDPDTILNLANFLGRNRIDHYLSWKTLTGKLMECATDASLHQLVSFAFLHATALPRSDEADEVFRKLSEKLVAGIATVETADLVVYVKACSLKEWRDLRALRKTVEELRGRGYLAELDGKKALSLAAQFDRLGCRVPELEEKLGGESSMVSDGGESKTWFKERATTRKIRPISGRKLRKF